MKVELSKNEETLLKSYFSKRTIDKNGCWEEPSLNELIEGLTGRLEDKKGQVITDPPDPRYVSKLKSIALNKIASALENLARSMRLEYVAFNSISKGNRLRYRKKALGILKGFNFSLNTEVYLIYTFSKLITDGNEVVGSSTSSGGAIAWYVHDSRSCSQCHPGGECFNILEQVINERALKIPPEVDKEEFGKRVEWVLRTLNEEGCLTDENR
ncbi:MAG: hypothetical protein ACTSP4_05160 [Candidatus Hodarchaeales archaeon]